MIFLLYLYIMNGFIKIKRKLKKSESSEERFGYHRISVDCIADFREWENKDEEGYSLVSITFKASIPSLGQHVVIVEPTITELEKLLNVK